ncbi:MAG: 7-cyano-7-deazaguanine synthase QueC [Brevinematia bacterium]
MILKEEAIVLHSGGLDSTTALFWAKNNFSNVIALNINYGQKHYVETFLSKKLCEELEIRRIEIDISSIKFLFSTSSLVGNQEIKEKEYPEKGIISTYVPMRNTLLGIIAGIVSERLDINNIVLGIHSSDSPNYPDTRPEWASALETVLTSGSKFSFENKRLKVHTPLINLSKKEIVILAKEFNVPFEMTWSCYSPIYLNNIVKPCMECPACNSRKKAFEEAGIQDTLSYVEF